MTVVEADRRGHGHPRSRYGRAGIPGHAGHGHHGPDRRGRHRGLGDGRAHPVGRDPGRPGRPRPRRDRRTPPWPQRPACRPEPVEPSSSTASSAPRCPASGPPAIAASRSTWCPAARCTRRSARSPTSRAGWPGSTSAGGYATFPGVAGTAVTRICALEIGRTGLSDAGGDRRRVRVRGADDDDHHRPPGTCPRRAG